MKTKLGSIVLAMILVIAAVSCGAERRYTAEQDISSDCVGIQKFAVSIQGDDVGYMTLDIREHGPDSFLVIQEIEWNMILMGVTRNIEMTLSAVTDREFALRSEEMYMSDGSAEINISAVRTDSELHITMGSAGRTVEISKDIETDYLPVTADLACAIMEWTEGQKRTFDTFDPSSMMILQVEAECLGFEEIDFLGDTVLAAKISINQMGTLNTIWIASGQIIREVESNLGMDMTRVPIDQVGNISPTRDLYDVFAVSSSIIKNPRTTGNRIFLLEGDIDWSQFDLSYPYVQLSNNDTVFVSTRMPAHISDIDTELPDSLLEYTISTPMIQTDDPKIVHLADSLTAECNNSWEKAKNISQWVDREIEDSPTVSLPSAVDVLENLRGDCNEHTILFVALARAAGLPCRPCAGVVYLPNGSFGYHAWPLVWVGEWVEMDPTLGQDVADATHIILATGDIEAQYVINSVIGNLSITELE